MSNPALIAALVREGLPPAALREHFPNLARETIRSHLRDFRRTLTPEERAEIQAKREVVVYRHDPVPLSKRDVLSPVHRRIGIKLATVRSQKGLSRTEFCSEYGFVNRVRLSAIEQGVGEISLREMQQLAEILGTDVAGLIAPVTAPAALGRTTRGAHDRA